MMPEPIEIVRETARRYGVRSSLVVGGSQVHRAVKARRAALLALRETCPDMTIDEIADVLSLRPSTAKALLRKLRAPPATNTDPDPHAVIQAFADRHLVPVQVILGRSRVRPVVRLRQEAMRAVVAACPGTSVSEIARAFRRDHTTVLHALKKGNKK